MSRLEALKGLRVLLTGHTGFKGAWLALWLRELGAEVLGLSLAPPTVPSLFERADIGALIEHLEGDIRNFEMLREVMDRQQPDLVFHLAAQALVRPSYENPRETFETNVGGSVNLLQHTLPRFGISCTFVDPRKPDEFAAAIRPETRLVFAETLGNPGIEVLDIPAVATLLICGL